jgi:hypothetical protein
MTIYASRKSWAHIIPRYKTANKKIDYDYVIADNNIIYNMEDNMVYFSSEHCLSNFHCGDIVITDGREVLTYSTGEHALHGEKIRRLGKACPDNIRKQLLFDHSKLFQKDSVITALDAKIGRGFRLSDDEISVCNNIGIYIQREICQWKLDNVAEVRLFIDETRDKTYGDLTIDGENMLGRIWMFVRDESL